MSTKLLFALSLFCLTSSGLSASTILYSDLGPGDSFIIGDGVTVAGYSGVPFTASASGNLGSITIGIAPNNTASDVLTLGLYTSLPDQPTLEATMGTLLESWTTTFPAGIPINQLTLTTLISLQNPFIAAGTQYWLVASPYGSGVDWSSNNQGVPGPVWNGQLQNGSIVMFYGGPPLPGPAIELDAAPVPEPNSAPSVGFASVVLLGLFAKSRRCQVKARPVVANVERAQ